MVRFFQNRIFCIQVNLPEVKSGAEEDEKPDGKGDPLRILYFIHVQDLRIFTWFVTGDHLCAVEGEVGNDGYPEVSRPEEKITEGGAEDQPGDKPFELEVDGAEGDGGEPDREVRPAGSGLQVLLDAAAKQQLFP